MSFESEVSLIKGKRYSSPGTEKVTAKPIKVGRITIHSEFHNLNNSNSSKK